MPGCETILLERNLRGLKSENPIVRGLACGHLGNLARYTDQGYSALAKVLATEKHEYARRSAAG